MGSDVGYSETTYQAPWGEHYDVHLYTKDLSSLKILSVYIPEDSYEGSGLSTSESSQGFHPFLKESYGFIVPLFICG